MNGKKGMLARVSRPAAGFALVGLLVTASHKAAAAPAEPKKVTSRIVYPPAPAPPVIEWVSTVGKLSDVDPGRGKWKKFFLGEGEKEPVLVAPTAVAIGPDETLYVVDRRAGGLVIVNPKTKRFEIWKGEGSGRLAEPVGVAASESGDLYVSDATHAAVFVFDAALRFRAALAPVKFRRPTALALSADGGTLAVCDTSGHRVYVLDAKDGRVLRTLGKAERSNEEGDFHTPVAVAFDEQGFLFVADYLNFRIQVFDTEGGVELVFGTAGDRPGNLNRPRGIAADAAAKVIYEVDAAFQLVQMFNFDGELLMWFGAPGDGPAQFQLPSGMARRGSLLAVTDTLNGRIQLFRFLGVPPSAAPPPRTVKPASRATAAGTPLVPPPSRSEAAPPTAAVPTVPVSTPGPAAAAAAPALAPAAAAATNVPSLVPPPASTPATSAPAPPVAVVSADPPAKAAKTPAPVPVAETKPFVPPAPAATPSGPAPLVTKDWAGKAAVFTVRFSNYRDRPSAEREAARLSAALHWPGQAVEVDLGEKGVSYDVVIGKFQSFEEARTFRRYLVARKTPGVGLVCELRGP